MGRPPRPASSSAPRGASSQLPETPAGGAERSLGSTGAGCSGFLEETETFCERARTAFSKTGDLP